MTPVLPIIPTCLVLHRPLPSRNFVSQGEYSSRWVKYEWNEVLKKGTKEEPGEIPGGDDPSLEKGPCFQEEAAHKVGS